MRNKWQMEYRNIHQESTKMVDIYVARFRKVINKAEMKNLLPAQMQVKRRKHLKILKVLVSSTKM